jgi:nucleoside-diphosphate-sugar epimerase
VGDSTSGSTSKFDNIYTFAKVMSNIGNGYLQKQMGIDNDPDGAIPDDGEENTVPIRVPGDPNTFVNLVPIDYVAGAITEILSRRDTIGKIFHIVNPHPPTIIELRDLLISILELKGIRLTIDGKMDGKHLRTNERLFLRQTRTYHSYLFSRLCFDCTKQRLHYRVQTFNVLP